MNYINLANLVREFKEFSLNVINHAITGKCEKANTSIKEGEFVCDMDDYSRARQILVYEKRFYPIISRLSGNKDYFFMALGFCFNDGQVDNEKLYTKFCKYEAGIHPVINQLQALEWIESIYNKNNKSESVYIATNYRMYQEGKYSWYASRYGRRFQKN